MQNVNDQLARIMIKELMSETMFYSNTLCLATNSRTAFTKFVRFYTMHPAFADKCEGATKTIWGPNTHVCQHQNKSPGKN